MAKRKIAMNAAEQERYDDYKTIRVVRSTIRKIRKEKKTVPNFLFDQLNEFKYKVKYPSLYRRALAGREEPWKR
jgi:hypothetical protein